MIFDYNYARWFKFIKVRHNAVADLEIFRGGFSFTKTPAKLEVKTKKKKKKVNTSFLSHFLLAASLPFSTQHTNHTSR